MAVTRREFLRLAADGRMKARRYKLSTCTCIVYIHPRRWQRLPQYWKETYHNLREGAGIGVIKAMWIALKVAMWRIWHYERYSFATEL